MNIDWLSITPQSGQAGTNPISFQLVSENESFEDKTIRVRAVCGNARSEKTIVLKGKTYPIGTVFNFAYTGSVQQVTLPKGRYKLQCWGAQGGNVTGSYTATGSKGGYSEGVLTLTEPTTIYVFVGGQGTSSSTSSTSGTANGGWNGGGASTRYSSYNSDNIFGESYPRAGGGATDMCLVTSTMNYSSGRTNRSSASLLSRFIVAGGGAGASARYTEEQITTDEWIEVNNGNTSRYMNHPSFGSYTFLTSLIPVSAGEYYRFGYTNPSTTGTKKVLMEYYDSNGSWLAGYESTSSTAPANAANVQLYIATNSTTDEGFSASSATWTLYRFSSSTSTSTSSEKSNSSQQGGGTSGRGQYPGTQNSAGSGGAFGLGANQTTSNYRYVSGAGGGGWYGGGKGQSDTGTNYVNYSGGGSGFVNTAANAGYRPSGYTGLQLDSGNTKDGSTSFPSTSGGNETGHSGNGYARITVVE